MRLVDAVVYGEIYNRPAVDLRTRSLCTIAALVVLGHSPQMIKRHITGALHIGVTEEEISEIIAQMVFYGGMPAAVNAFRIAKETFDEQEERAGCGATPGAGSPRYTQRYAPPYRRENVGDYAPSDLSEEEQPRVRLREQSEQDDPARQPAYDRPQRGPAPGDRPQRGHSTRRPATTRPSTRRPATARPGTRRPATTRPSTRRPATKRQERRG